MIEYTEPLLQCENMKVYVTYHLRRRLTHRFGFPGDIEQTLHRLNRDFSEGWYGEKRGYLIDFTGKFPIRVVLFADSHKKYIAITVMTRREELVLTGNQRVKINGIYKEKPQEQPELTAAVA